MREAWRVTAFDWHGFLQEWNDEILRSRSLADRHRHFPDDDLATAVASGWLGYPGATPDDIARTEARLGTTLPPSYRTFLMTSNGWWHPSDFVPKLWSTHEIEWLRVRHRPGIDAWREGAEYGGEPLVIPDEEYFVYGEQQDPTTIRREYLETALDISAVELAGTAMYVLNPRVVAPPGEWEAWFWAHWLPGAVRHRSF